MANRDSVDWRRRRVVYFVEVTVNHDVFFITSIFIGKCIFSIHLKDITLTAFYCFRFITWRQFQIIKPRNNRVGGQIIRIIVLCPNLKGDFLSLGIEFPRNLRCRFWE